MTFSEALLQPATWVDGSARIKVIQGLIKYMKVLVSLPSVLKRCYESVDLRLGSGITVEVQVLGATD